MVNNFSRRRWYRNKMQCIINATAFEIWIPVYYCLAISQFNLFKIWLRNLQLKKTRITKKNYSSTILTGEMGIADWNLKCWCDDPTGKQWIQRTAGREWEIRVFPVQINGVQLLIHAPAFLFQYFSPHIRTGHYNYFTS